MATLPIFVEFKSHERNGNFVKTPILINIDKIVSVYETDDSITYIALSNSYGWYVDATLEEVENILDRATKRAARFYKNRL